MARLTRFTSVLAFTLAVASACLLSAAPAHAQDVPKLTAPVNDFAHVLDPDTIRVLDDRIRALQETTGDVLIVATVTTYQPSASIEEYATRLFEVAGIGKKGENNGVLLLVAVQDHRVRIEVGYGLEEFITDGFSGDTIRQTMLPAFRANDYAQGILAATTQIVRRLGEARGKEIPGIPKAVSSVRVGNTDGFPASTIIAIIIFLVFGVGTRLMGMMGGFRGPRRPGGPWGGFGGLGGFGGGGFGGGGFGGGGFGGGGGGFGGFGGGSSGGGGASGGW